MDRISLYDLNLMISDAIAETFPSALLVEAELLECREVKGHCFMELVEKSPFSTTPLARAQAKCWHNTWMKVAPKFLSATGTPLQPGMKLLLQVLVEFHAAYGYSLVVQDIDPTFTLGDMARKRQEIISQLKTEGVFDLQHELSLPLFSQRIAVISSETAAGYGDFCQQMLSNEYGFKFSLSLFPSVMQGEQTAESIISALDQINARLDEFDCVVIIRGGGATADMSGFDSLPLAENVANFPLPILTGIGHDRDECILDLIACQRLKTPTAVAAFLIDKLAEIDERIIQAEQIIKQSAFTYLERQKFRLSRAEQFIHHFTSSFLDKQNFRISSLFDRICSNAKVCTMHHRHRLELLEQRILALDPMLPLKRGYTLTSINGKSIKSITQVSPGDELTTLLADGKITSIAK